MVTPLFSVGGSAPGGEARTRSYAQRRGNLLRKAPKVLSVSPAHPNNGPARANIAPPQRTWPEPCFFARCGSLFAVGGCVEVLLHSILVLLSLSQAPTTPTRSKDFQRFRRVAWCASSVAVQAPDGIEPWGWGSATRAPIHRHSLGVPAHDSGELCADKGVRGSVSDCARWLPRSRGRNNYGRQQVL